MGANALQPLTDNIPPPTTPGKQVKTLKAELEKKDAENEALRNSIAELTNALTGLNVVSEKIGTDGNNNNNVEVTKSNNKKDKDAPVPAQTAYKFFCEANPKQDGVDMRQVWKECAPEIRETFLTMAGADKARYLHEFAVYEEEKVALEMYYEKKKEDMAMEFLDAHITAQAALEKADADKKGKKKVKKDPEAPKRPTSSYMYFAVEKRESVTKQNTNTPPTEIMKILGEMWSKLDKGKKGKNGTKKFDDLAAEDKARYESEKAEYDAMIAERNIQSEQEKLDRLKQDKEEAMKLMKSFQDASAALTSDAMDMVAANMEDMSVVSELTTKSKKKKDPNAPKKASTAYIFFCTENRAMIKSKMPENTPQNELLTEVGRQWKELTDKKKEKYVKMTNKDKERYAKEMEKYNAEKQ
jgi:hypothetical protein